MINITQKHTCCGCQGCAQICPRNCIRMQCDEEGFWYPVVDKERCISCGLCEKVCPVINSKEIQKETPVAYAAQCTQEHIREISSSGGIFSVLAEHILAQNGTVYGAVLENQAVKHIRVADSSDLGMLRGSKYVQSNIGNTYLEAKQDLNDNKLVLFSGTPCQIEGLLYFLGKEYPNLICMDFICHGVPSPTVWKRYVSYREEKANARMVNAFFRRKHYGWKSFTMQFVFDNGTEEVQMHNDDLYMHAFLHDLSLRPSCYQCSFKKLNRISDITVADFWGINKVSPKMNDDKGTSLVILHSQKGKEIFSKICSSLLYQQVDFHDSIKGNYVISQSAKQPHTRDAFLQQVQEAPFDIVVDKYDIHQTFIKKYVKKILRKMNLLNFVRKFRGG